MLKRCVLSCVLLVGLVSLAQAVTFYVDNDATRCPSCADANTCTQAQTITTGRDTIGEGMECLSAGDVLMVRGGTYPLVRTSLHTLNNGTSGSKIIVQKYQSEVPIIQPANGCWASRFDSTISHWVFDGLIWDGRNLGPTCTSGNQRSTIRGLSGATNITFKNGIIRHGSSAETASCGQNLLWSGNNLTVQNMEIDGTHQFYGDYQGSHGIYVDGSADDVVIEDNNVHDNGSIGIQFNDSNTGSQLGERGIVRRNRVHHNLRRTLSQSVCGGGTGITVSARQTDMLVYNNLVYDNGVTASVTSKCLTVFGTNTADNALYNNTCYNHRTSCIRIGEFTAAANTIVKNNICLTNGEGIRIYQSATGTVVADNNIYNNPTPVQDSGVGSSVDTASIITTNPLLVNPGAADFHLQPTSPSINSGIDLTSVFTTDFAGTPRTPDTGGDTAWEMGAYTVATTILPNHLIFSTPPTSGILVGATFTVVVQILDSANTPQDLDSGDVTISKTAGSGTLGGTLTATPLNGTATFTNLTLDAADDDYRLTVTRTDTDPATTSPFSVVTTPSSTVQYFQIR